MQIVKRLALPNNLIIEQIVCNRVGQKGVPERNEQIQYHSHSMTEQTNVAHLAQIPFLLNHVANQWDQSWKKKQKNGEF